ncbi:hypothetical protein [Sphingomonas sp. Root241]|nr:hypothetical protein [Sphingomonas sp. Root241]
MEQRSIRVDHIGAERQPVVVVENFAPIPKPSHSPLRSVKEG